MGLVDPSILQQRGNPLAEGIQSGMGIGQAFQQGQDRRRTEAAKAAFQAAAQGKDITTPEGMGAAIKGMVDAGFADEGRKVYEAHKDLFAQAKPQPDEFESKDTEKGYVSFNKRTGKYDAPALDPTGQPLYSATTAEKVKKDKADFDFGKSIPTYDTALKAIGSDMTKRDLLASKVMADHPDSPKAEKYITTVIKSQSPWSASAAPPSQNDSNQWVDFLGNKGDFQTFMTGMGGIRGPARQKAIIDILAKTKGKYPDFDVVGAKAGIKQAEDVTNNRVLNLINGVMPNMKHLTDLSDKIQRSGIKFVSKAELAASRQFSDEDLANFDTMKNLTADEINQIFAGGKGGSDMSRHMALDLINEKLPPKQFASTMKTIYAAMQNRAAGIRAGFHGYGGQPAAAPEAAPQAGAPHPQDSEAVQWAKANPKDPRSAAILKANGM